MSFVGVLISCFGSRQVVTGVSLLRAKDLFVRNTILHTLRCSRGGNRPK